MDAAYQQIKNQLGNIELNRKLSDLSSFGIGGPAKYFYIAKNNFNLAKAVKISTSLNIKFFLLGNGTNVLISDSGFDGLIIKQENRKINIEGDEITADSGVNLQTLLQIAASHGLSGLEFIVGIPGLVGAGIAGNIGTADYWISSKVKSLEVFDKNGKWDKMRPEECKFSYRNSCFKEEGNKFVGSACFKLEYSSSDTIKKKINFYLKKRNHQPKGVKTAGSIFKNPKGFKAWELIDRVGLRGKTIGGAQVSEKHANFIVNKGGATAEDIVMLISLIKQQVRDKLGVQLQEEIQYIGF